MCGEQCQATDTLRNLKGSPPRVRGTVLHERGLSHGCGITPACAGNSSFTKAVRVLAGDHPRVCGEQETPRLIITSVKGSPPRVRGTGHDRGAGFPAGRITPACAGNRQPESSRQLVRADHPRVCGEQSYALSKKGRIVGSPPRVRGTDSCI